MYYKTTRMSKHFFKESDGSRHLEIYRTSEGKLGLTELRLHKNPLCFNIVRFLKEVFLPHGFPDTVHPDYVPYQLWDTVQAFASTIMGTLTAHSIMKGMGVGESTATPLAAAITWILKDGTGMIGRILFAWWKGTDLDRQCKKWRLYADILNDVAMGFELCIPYFYNYSMAILCTSTAMKSIVGVAGGATRAAVTQHQALHNNLADVSAKDGSQETCVNLVASFLGIFLLSCLHNSRYFLVVYFLLVFIHLYANYSAVKALQFNSFNEERLAITIQNYITNESIPDPKTVNKQESILSFNNLTKHICGFYIKAGVSFANIIKRTTISLEDTQLLLKLYERRKYIIVVDTRQKTIFICLAADSQADLLKAYFHAYLCGLFMCMSLKLQNELLMNAETHNPSYPLIRVFLLYKKNLHTITADIAVRGFYATDSIIDKEYKNFAKGILCNEWTVKNNILPVGTWRLTGVM